ARPDLVGLSAGSPHAVGQEPGALHGEHRVPLRRPQRWRPVQRDAVRVTASRLTGPERLVEVGDDVVARGGADALPADRADTTQLVRHGDSPLVVVGWGFQSWTGSPDRHP